MKEDSSYAWIGGVLLIAAWVIFIIIAGVAQGNGPQTPDPNCQPSAQETGC
jgi:hypothetical protein